MNYIEVFAAAFSTLFFGIIFNLTGRKLIYSSFAGGLGWYTYLLLYKEMGYSKTAAYLFSAIVITAFSEIIGRLKRTTVTTTLIQHLFLLFQVEEFTILCHSLLKINFQKLWKKVEKQFS